MNKRKTQVLMFAFALLSSPAARTDGEVCTAAQKTQAETAMKRAEDAERTGRLKEAYDSIGAIRPVECVSGGYKRRDAVLERVSKKLGDEAEKAGRYGQAFDYYRAPASNRTDYNLADADRALMKHAKASADNYKVVSSAASWFSQRNDQKNLAEIRAIAKASGGKALAAEDKAFAATRISLVQIEKAREWLRLAGDDKPALMRAVQRGDTLLATGAFSAVERGFQYYEFAHDQQKLKSAKDRARQLGDQHAKDGQIRIAAQFYELAGDSAKAAAVAKQATVRDEKKEARRREQFQKDQKSLEKELGL